MFDISKLISVGLGGFIGAISRFWVSGLSQRMSDRFPLGTLSVNLLGSFLLGLLTTLFLDKFVVSDEIRLFILVGLLGAFTTYSTFSFETMALIQNKDWLFAGLNIFGNVLGTLLAVWAGMSLAKLW